MICQMALPGGAADRSQMRSDVFQCKWCSLPLTDSPSFFACLLVGALPSLGLLADASASVTPVPWVPFYLSPVGPQSLLAFST